MQNHATAAFIRCLDCIEPVKLRKELVDRRFVPRLGSDATDHSVRNGCQYQQGTCGEYASVAEVTGKQAFQRGSSHFVKLNVERICPRDTLFLCP